MVRFTNKMNENYSHYNLNNNKALLDKLNTQMSTKKKINEPMEDPTVSIRSLHFRGTLSEYNQYLGKNISDALSWTDTTQTAIDTAKELMRSLKAEYTSAANGTNETKDRWSYYEGMVNLVNEFFNTGNTTNENRYVFSNARTGDSLTFSDKNFADRAKENGGVFIDDHIDTFKYKGITEYFKLEDVESYNYIARKGDTGSDGYSGITESEIASVGSDPLDPGIPHVDETNVQNVEVFRLRLSYKDLDKTQEGLSGDPDKKSLTLYVKNGSTTDTYSVDIIENDYEIDQDSYGGNKVYLNVTTGNLLFGSDIKTKVTDALSGTGEVYFLYDKFRWETGDAKPEHFFDCVDVGMPDPIVYDDRAYKKEHPDTTEQDVIYNIGESQIMKINTSAEDVYSLAARRDLNEIYDALTAKDNADKKMATLKDMQEDTTRYPDEDSQRKIQELINAVEKEQEYLDNKINKMLSNGITKSGGYFDTINLAGTNMGSIVNRLTLVKNRLTEHQTTVTAQASDNENIDISTLAVEVNSATLSYGAALQVTGKISQQSLVNFL